MEKTIPLRMKIYGFLCALLLCLSWIPALGQSCPDLKKNDFVLNVVPPNSECNIPGQLTIRYNGAIVTYKSMAYDIRLGESGDSHYLEAPAPGAPVRLELPADMAPNTKVVINITAGCAQNYAYENLELEVSPKNSADVQLHVVSTPAGNGTGTSGGVQVSLQGAAGFTEATFYLYKKSDLTTVVAKQRSTRPYEGVNFFNLSPGEYVVKADAKPGCTPTVTPANWKTDHFELEANVTIDPFNLITKGIPGRGTCTGGVKVEVSKINGVEQLEYKLAKKTEPGTVLQSTTVHYPQFTHTFVGLPLGDYLLTATEKSSNSSLTKEFTVENDSPEIQVTQVHGSFNEYDEGEVNITLPNTTAACPAKYTITFKDQYNQGITFPTIVKENITEETTLITGLKAGAYQVQAEFGGETKTAEFNVESERLPWVYPNTKDAAKICEASGSASFDLSDSRYYVIKATIINKNTGALVREFSIPPTQQKVEIKNLFPGNYKLRLEYEKAKVKDDNDFTVTGPSLEGEISVDLSAATTTLCGEKPLVRIPVKYTGDGGVENAPNVQAFLNGATFRIRMYNNYAETEAERDKVLYTGTMPELTGNEVAYIEAPVFGNRLDILSSCGFPEKNFGNYGDDINKFVYKFSPDHTFRGCGGTGTDVNLQVLGANSEPLPLITYKVKKKGTDEVVAEYVMKEGVNTAIIASMKPGDYTVEWFAQCAPTQVHTEELHVEDKVIAKKEDIRTFYASCGEDGSISITFTNFANIRAWRHELYRASDNKLIRAYGTDQTNKVEFDRLPAGKYIVKSTPIVECGEITPGRFEVEVEAPEHNYRSYYKESVERKVTPFKNDGVARYYYNGATQFLKWRVFDIITGAKINEGEALAPNPKNPEWNMKATVDKLPQTYRIEFETECETYSMIDSLELNSDNGLPGFKTQINYPQKKCGLKGSITIESLLKAAGLPDSGSKIELSKSTEQGYKVVAEQTNPSAIIESHTFSDLDPGYYKLYYYYNGTSSFQIIELPENTEPTVDLRDSYFGPTGIAFIEPVLSNFEPGVKVRLVFSEVISGSEEKELLTTEVLPYQRYRFELKSNNEEYEGRTIVVRATPLSGCFANQTLRNSTYVNKPNGFPFDVVRKEMKCQNDGEITLTVPEYFQNVDQIHYELTNDSDPGFRDEAETTTPAIPKKFIGLTPGYYKIKARATIFKNAQGEAQVFDGERTFYLNTSYNQPLYATARPDYMVPTSMDCPNGRIGLSIENGREDNYRVYLKSTPDGVLNPMKEIFTDLKGTPNYRKLWGEGLKPGKYSLVVKDGCMDVEIPEAEILDMPNTPKFTLVDDYLTLDDRTNKHLDETRDSVYYYLRFDPSAFPEKYRQIAYRAYEVQVVAKDAAPDDKQWKSNWEDRDDGKAFLRNYANRFNNCEGADVLFRFKGCPSSLVRIPTDLKIDGAFQGIWSQLKCNTVQWAFHKGDIGKRYKIRVTRTEDNQVVREKEVLYNTPEEYLKRDPDLEFPADKSYSIEMTPLEYCANTVIRYTYHFNAIERKYKFELEENGYDGILSDCDGRQFNIYAWTDCKFAMKYFVYEVEGTQENLVVQSGNYVPYNWFIPYKFKKDKTYIIRVVEYGQPEDQQIELTKFTLNFKLPVGYEITNNETFKSNSFCGYGYDAKKKGFDLNQFSSRLLPKWADNDPYVQPYRYVTIPKMTIVATQKAAPHRKFVATEVWRYYNELRTRKWKEQLPNGKFSEEAFAPEGEYTIVAKTDCGEFPMADDYIGRPTIDLNESTVEVACDGKFTVTPKGSITYNGGNSDAEIVSFYVSGDAFNTTRNWGESFPTYQRDFSLVVNLRLKSTGKVCTVNWPFSMSRYILGFDQSQSMSLFCADSGKGIIHMALKGGQPPYTYKLMTPDEEEIETKTVPGGVDFLRGQLGEVFRIKATDKCGLSWVYQDVAIQDPAAVSSSMKGEAQFCEGDRAVLKARSFPNVTYEWRLPNGTTVPGQELSFIAQKNSGGDYFVDIHLTTCTVTLTGKYEVGIATLKETDNFPKEKHACAGESVAIEADAPQGTIDGEDAASEIRYDWEMTKTPNDDNSWRSINNTYTAGQNLKFTQNSPGVYYVRRVAQIGSCKAISEACKITLAEGINVAMTPEEREKTIDHKNPFTLTAGIVTGNPNRTYQWQRSVDKKTWENVGTEETFTEDKRLAGTVYYRRNISSQGCFFEGALITVHFKKKRGAYINPQLRQRTYQD